MKILGLPPRSLRSLGLQGGHGQRRRPIGAQPPRGPRGAALSPTAAGGAAYEVLGFLPLLQDFLGFL